ncbi:MAG TPA: hypothetical protein VHN80_30005, partial [Kineosporiaceae bacterium]|nr:hypothetical protein [Kineosporiaceae bacterium]
MDQPAPHSTSLSSEPALAQKCEIRAVWGVTEFAEHPSAEHDTHPGLGQDDLSARVLAKMGRHLPVQGRDLLVRVPRRATRARTEDAYAAVTWAGWRSCWLRSASQIAAALVATSRRRARL